MIIAVTGSTGMVGTAVVAALEARGDLVRRLVRHAVTDGDREIRWDPDRGEIDAAELNGVDAVVHLAGENIAGARWSAEFKRRILESRTKGTRLLAETLAGLEMKPSVLVSASATGIYGNRHDEEVDELAPSGNGFLAEVCREWEAAVEPAHDADIRVVKLRIGPVLSPKGGALAKMLLPFKMGVGGVIAGGQQYFSWITLDDLVSAILFALDNESLKGPVNAVTPHPVTNREFTKTLGHVLGRPTIFPMPAFAARLAFGEMADEMLIGGVKVSPHELIQAGFPFTYPELEPALRHLLK
jgi:uncharacterized protein (TIGR01777 family)